MMSKRERATATEDQVLLVGRIRLSHNVWLELDGKVYLELAD